MPMTDLLRRALSRAFEGAGGRHACVHRAPSASNYTLVARTLSAQQRAGSPALQCVRAFGDKPRCTVERRNGVVKFKAAASVEPDGPARSAPAAVSSAVDEEAVKFKAAASVERAAPARSAPLAGPSTVDEEAVRKGTDEWIRRFLLRNALCPFAAKSTWTVSVHLGKLLDENDIEKAVEKILVEVRELNVRFLEKIVEYQKKKEIGVEADENRVPVSHFIVWPEDFWDQEKFDAFVGGGGPLERKISGYQSGLVRPNPVVKPGSVTGMPFHPNSFGPALASPWPMLHLIPTHGLYKARYELGREGQSNVLDRNMKLFLNAGVQGMRQAGELRAECRAKVSNKVYTESWDPELRFEVFKAEVE